MARYIYINDCINEHESKNMLLVICLNGQRNILLKKKMSLMFDFIIITNCLQHYHKSEIQ